nr:protein kinase [Oscillochloris trichoides]
MVYSATACRSCGATYRNTARFCPQCGTQIVRLSDSAEANTNSLLLNSWIPILSKTPSLKGPWPQGIRIDPLGRYAIEHRIGKGGFGEAYIARDTRLGRRCVIKRLVADARWNQRIEQMAVAAFTREAHVLVALNTPGHPNIPEIYDFFAESRCLVMKYVVGEDLGQVLQQRNTGLPLAEVLQIAHDLCSAIFYLHSRTPAPVLHRDIKPANLLRDSEGRIWLIDFGLAKDTLIAEDLVSGTPGYAPPEQWHGQSQPASDIYALGATLYTLLTGDPPPPPQIFTDEDEDEAVERWLPDLPQALEDLLVRTLVVDPAVRPDARTCLEVIDALLTQSQTPAPPPLAQPPVPSVFVGRETELATLEARMQVTPALAMIGIAGVGKTALATRLAARIGSPNALFWYRCADGSGAMDLIWALAIFLAHRGLTDLWAMLQRTRQMHGTMPPLTVLADYACALLRKDRAEPLLLLDDLHLVEDHPDVRSLCERFVTEAATGSLRLIITSRTVPQLGAGLALYAVDGLDLGTTRTLLETRNLHLSGVQLTLLRQLTGGNAQLLGLASEVLGSQDQSDPEALLRQLATSSNIERFLLREVDAALSEQERTLMCAVAALLDTGGTSDAVEALVDRNPQRTLRELAARGLLSVSEGRYGPVYAQHAILQGFFYAQLSRRERRRYHRCAAAFYDEEEPNALRAALHYERAGEVERAAEIAVRNAWAIVGSGQSRSLGSLLEHLRSADLPATLRAQVFIASGDVESLAGAPEQAHQSYTQALAALDAAGDASSLRVLRARACRGIGRLLEVSLPHEALAWLVRGQAELGGVDAGEEAELCNKLGGVQMRLGNLAEAERMLERAQELMPPGPSQLRINLLHTLGTLHSTRGAIQRGMEYTRQGITMCEQLHDSVRAGQMLANLGFDRLMMGDITGAHRDLEQALTYAHQVGNRQLEAMALINLGLVALRAGDYALAATMTLDGIRLAHELRLHIAEMAGMLGLADLRIRQGLLNEAEQVIVAIEGLVTTTNTTTALAEIARLRANLLLAQAQPLAALDTANHALALATEQQNELEVGYALAIVGHAQHAAGRTIEACGSFARAVAILDSNDHYEAARTRIAWANALTPTNPNTAATLRTAGQAEMERQGIQPK